MLISVTSNRGGNKWVSDGKFKIKNAVFSQSVRICVCEVAKEFWGPAVRFWAKMGFFGLKTRAEALVSKESFYVGLVFAMLGEKRTSGVNIMACKVVFPELRDIIIGGVR